MPHSRQLAASTFETVDKAESQLMKLSAEAEDTNAVVASAAAVKVTRIFMGPSPSVVRPALIAEPDLRPFGDAIGAGAQKPYTPHNNLRRGTTSIEH
jgi:hypothetical protein